MIYDWGQVHGWPCMGLVHLFLNPFRENVRRKVSRTLRPNRRESSMSA